MSNLICVETEVSEKNEQILQEELPSKTSTRRNLTCVWLLDENSKLYCKWVNE